MLAYILSYKDLTISDILEYESYDFHTDIDFASKSTITVARKPNVVMDDFVVCKDGNEVVFVGICDDYSTATGAAYKITMRQKENLFDRAVIGGSWIGDMSDPAVGIEGAIANVITAGWAANPDPMLERPYMAVSVLTRTTTALAMSSIVNTENTIFNFKTFLGNVLELYRIQLGFDFSVQGTLTITIGQDTAPALTMNAYDTDVASYKETLSVNVLAVLNVLWGVVVGGEVTSYSVRAYYLRNDRTVTMDVNDPARVMGKVDSIYVEAETAAEVDEEAYNSFKSNTYAHKIEFTLRKASKIYDQTEFYVGRPCTVRTKTGIQTTLVTGRAVNNTSNVVSLIFGKLKVTLIEKIRSKS